MRIYLPITAAIAFTGIALSSLVPISAANADYADNFTYTSGNATARLPQPPYTFLVGSTNTTTQGTASLDGTTNLLINAGNGGGVFSGIVPSVTVLAGSVSSTWSISTTVSFNWGSLTAPSQLYPDGGITIFNNSGNEFDFHLKRQVTTTAAASGDYFEASFNETAPTAVSATNFFSDFSNRVYNGSGVAYTLTIAKVANGNILLEYMGTGFSGGALSTALTITPTGTETAGTGFSTPTNSASSAALYTFLNSLDGKQIGLFTDRQSEATNSYAGSFDNLSITGASIVTTSAPEPGAFALLLVPVALSLITVRRRRVAVR